MLRWAFVFFLISIVAGIFGFTGIAISAVVVAKTLFFIAISLFLMFLLGGLLIPGPR